jgi:hypothetical protein
MFTVTHESDSYGLHRIRGGAWAVVYQPMGYGYVENVAAVEPNLHRALDQGAETVGIVMNNSTQLGRHQVQWITITQCLVDTKDFSTQQYWDHVKIKGHFWSGTVLYFDPDAAQRWADLANQLIFWYRLAKPSRPSVMADLS